ncbi:hypothetical protein [Fulvivirga lutea]|uniref:DUF4878 domain-containing protein n=1 Tax=Fulvivirga lutea TaxID=2810512 RepID=A0A974WFU7_9BACT|nr:hypothetical protein [Fulvivirga lutea]QSE96773.1 hypothetical protein JR347_14390 [Fulvivirga lutea]
MKKLYILVLPALLSTFSCSNQSKEETSENNTEVVEETTSEEVEIEGFKTIEKLAASVVKSLKERDYDSYYSHIMTKEMEMSQAEKIQDSTIRKEFLHEYGFSLHEEQEYFDNLLHFFDTKNIDLDKVVMADLVYTEYKGGEYHPLELYEVIVPIEMDYEIPIDFTVIKVDGKYYLTSELGV